MNKSTYTSDLYIYDYTNSTQSKRGVEASIERPDDIGPFYLRNRNAIKFDFVNFEQNAALFKRNDGTTASQCECMCVAARDKDEKGWLMLLELKYCQEKNISSNVSDALDQLIAARNWFIEKNPPIIEPEHRLYFAISSPGNSLTDVFDAFFPDPDKSLEVKTEYGATILFSNEVEIMTAKHLGVLNV